MATTSPYSIYYPVASDSVAPLHTAFSTLADSVNTALSTHVAPLTASQQNGAYTVASVAAMNALTGMAIGSTAYVTATSAFYQYNGTSWVLMYQPWTGFSLTMYDGPTTAISAGFTVNNSEYMVANNQVTVQVKLTVSGTSLSFTSLYANLPLTSRAVLEPNASVGAGSFKNSSTYPVNVWSHSTTRVRLLYMNGSPLKNSDLSTSGGTNPAAWPTGSTLVFKYTYSLP